MTKFQLFLLVMVCLVPLCMIIFGYIFSNHPPKKVGSGLGYRTTMSSLNEDTWRFAHQYFGKTWFSLGWLTLVLTVGAMWLNSRQAADWLGDYAQLLLMIQMLPFFVPIFLTEYALRKNFYKDGRRKKGAARSGGNSSRKLKRR